MRIHLHTLCWNDRPLLEYFFRHYEPWVDRFFILDDGSTDGTLEFLYQRSDVEVDRVTRTDPTSWVASAKAIYDSDWKRSRGDADWVVVTNIDEHLHHPDMRAHLRRLKQTGATIAPALGYQMLSRDRPSPLGVLWRECPMGAPWRNMSKVGIFRPDKIEETDFAPGRHTANIKGEIVYPDRDEIANLHYKYIWGLTSTHERHLEQSERLGAGDREQGWGHKYGWSIDQLGEDFAVFEGGLVDTRFMDHNAQHREPRWWREQNWSTVVSPTRRESRALEEVSRSEQPAPFEYLRPPFNFNATQVSQYPAEVTGFYLLERMRERIGWRSWEGKALLDFGCGTRFAQAVFNLGVPLKSYVGVDVNKPAIAWLRDHTSEPQMRFFHLNARNGHYNPSGDDLDSDALKNLGVPICDAACMFSVITHQTPDEASVTFAMLHANVIERGKLYFTAFIDDYGPDYWDAAPESVSLNSTYHPDALMNLLEASGWKLQSIHPRGDGLQETALVAERV